MFRVGGWGKRVQGSGEFRVQGPGKVGFRVQVRCGGRGDGLKRERSWFSGSSFLCGVPFWKSCFGCMGEEIETVSGFGLGVPGFKCSVLRSGFRVHHLRAGNFLRLKNMIHMPYGRQYR